MKHQLHLTGAGNIYPFCCDFDLCNSDMCTAMNLPAGNSKCVTTITNKLEQAALLQQGVINNEVENSKPQVRTLSFCQFSKNWFLHVIL